MSAEAMGWAYRHSPYRGAKFDVHLAVADSVNDQHGNDLWITQARLAEKARVSRDAVNKAMQQLVKDGMLELLEDNASRGRANRYRFVFKDDAEVHYESRAVPKVAQGVVGDDTPQDAPPQGGVAVADTPVVADDKVPDEGVQSETTGVQSTSAGGAVQDDNKNPREPKANPNSSATPRSAVPDGTGLVTIFIDDDEHDIDPADPTSSFNAWWDAYPRHPSSAAKGGGGSRKVAADRWRKMSVVRRRASLEAIGNYHGHLSTNGHPPMYAERWLSQQQWETFAAPPDTTVSGIAEDLASLCGIDPEAMTGPAIGDLRQIAAALEHAGTTGEQLDAVRTGWRRDHPDIPLTPQVVLKHVHRYGSTQGRSKASTSLCPKCRMPSRSEQHTADACQRRAALIGDTP